MSVTPISTPFRLRLAQAVCRSLPPLMSQKVRGYIYPLEKAYRDDFEFTVRSQTGSIFRNRTSDFHGYPFSVHGYYEWRNWAIALALCSYGDTIIEIGANIGTETIGFRDIVGNSGRVIAFEPLPGNFQSLKHVLLLNNCKNVSAFPLALGRKSGRARFVLPDKKGASGIGHLSEGGKAWPAKSIEVDCATLDSMSQRIGKAKMIFIDTEGAETEVIDGAMEYIGKNRPYIVLEASPQLLNRAGSSLEELHLRLKGLGYEAFVISRLGLNGLQQLETTHAANWLCIPAGLESSAQRVRRSLSACGLLPCIAGLNPLGRRRLL
ncbi:MAG: hypothetical protein JWQ71_291 [Pedosphaera sp.]|nr:hypothetical protein [Pedosphaera sp.]